MRKIRGFILVDFGDTEIRPVYVENPLREFIEPGDEVLVRIPSGSVFPATACCEIQTAYSEEETDRKLRAILKVARAQSVTELPRLIGTVTRDYWYGDPEKEGQDAE